MGFWADVEQITKEKEAAKALKNATKQYNYTVSKTLKIEGGQVTAGKHTFPVTGVTAALEAGLTQQGRVTATRLVAGTLAFGEAGTIAGGMAKKNTTNLYVVFTHPDGTQTTGEARAKDEGKVRQFVDTVNAASAAL